MAVRVVGKPTRMCLATVAAVLVVVGGVFAQGPPAKEPPADGIPITLPGGLVIVIGGKTKPPPKPESVILTAEQYKELLDKLEKLQAQVDAQQPIKPRSCEIEGKVEVRGRQAVVRLRATFKFTTARPNTLVQLGCQKAHAIEAKGDDGKLPILTATDDGLRVLAESPGDHTVRLELDVPLTARGPKGAELGFEVGLPGSPITALTFEPPAGVRRYNLTTKIARAGGPAATDSETEQPEIERFLPGKGGAPVGPITTLIVAWDDPGRKTDTPRSAEADILVTVGAAELTTEAKIRLRGPAAEWQFAAPASADVTVVPASRPGLPKAADFPADRAPNVLRPDPGQTGWRIVFREPYSADLLLTVVTKQPRPRGTEPAARGPFPVGPFVVLNVPQQAGTIRLRAPSNLRPTATLKGETTRETEEGTGETIYRYRQTETATAPKDPPVTLTLTSLPGTVNARVRHELRLTESGWKLRSEIAVSPARTEVENIDVELPSAFRIARAEPPEIVEELAALRESGPDRQIYRVRLTTPKKASFAFTVEGDYPVPAGPGSATLILPRLVGVVERSAEVLATSPPRFDLRGSVRVWENGKPGDWPVLLTPDAGEASPRLRVTSDRPIAVAELVWRPVASAATVESDSDVDIDETRVRVSQRLRFRFSGQVPDGLHLRSSRPVTGVQAIGGTVESAGEGWNVHLADQAAREQEIRLTYWAPAVAGDTEFTLPLLVSESGLASQSIRVWTSRPGTPRLVELGDWTESATEIVPARAELPALVVRARGPAAPPTIIVRPVAETDAGLTVDRVRIEVTLTEVDAIYRCQYWFRDWRKDAELSLPVGARAVELFVQGKRPNVSAELTRAGAGTRMIVRRPAGVTGSATIDVRYRAPSDPLEAPAISSPGVIGDVTWVIATQPASVCLVPGSTSGGWSLASFLNVFGLGSRVLPGFESPGAAPDTIVVHQTAIRPVTVYQVPRVTWVLGCSLVAAAVCGLLLVASRRRRRLLILIGIAGIAAGAILISQPMAEATFAALPGVTGFGIAVVVYRWVRLHYRRRVARVVGFARPGSTLIRPSSSSAKHREAAAPEIPAAAAAPSSS
jgi:hypothetical protein